MIGSDLPTEFVRLELYRKRPENLEYLIRLIHGLAMSSVQPFYVFRSLQLGVGRETERARSAQVEIDGLTGLKFLKSGFALLLLNRVPLPNQVVMSQAN
jgi:hypothetical protein